MSRIGKRQGLSSRELFLEAFTEALERAPRLSREKIGAIYVGSQSETYEHQIMYGTLIAEAAGLVSRPAVRVEGCAAAGALAFRSAIIDVMSGLHDVVMAVGVEKMTGRTVSEVTDALMAAGDLAFEQRNGLTFPSLYAMMATSHMKRYGSTEEDLALVAVKNHENASRNPKAHLQRRVTLEEALKSRVVAWPLKLYDCAPISDGAAVAILARADLAGRLTDTPLGVLGMGLATDTLGLYSREDLSWPSAVATACAEAYSTAAISPGDVDLAEVHDAFTINEILICEAAGFAGRGAGHLLVRNGGTRVGGAGTAVNTSGGLKARGHPTGATGLAQVYEAYLQLTGQAEQGRQVEGAKIALTVNEGGSDAVVAAHVIGRAN